MNAPSVIPDPSTADPLAELWFVEPAGFVPLPLEVLLPEPGSSAGDALQAAAAPLLDAAPDEAARRQFVTAFATGQQLLKALNEAGTVHCSIGLHRDDVGDVSVADSRGPLFSLFTVSWRETGVAPRGVTAARAVTSADGHAQIGFAELPCGPATFSETAATPAPGSGLPQRPLLQLHAYLPHPDCRRLAVLTLTTTAPGRRDEYRAILRLIAESASFENPLGEASGGS
ncbi:hypothetical protein GCM10010266_14730 [Streptomyces griseomycini]|uniref:hypothetical protein n=1 Tax=Streptomyces griseomycini TaxID=66895 RepID=UPI0018758367|nr:hypothetical protein [Streptomyces griseomycini]GGP93054.1 hypothetical protein GCM10010266_14730 [Streptomyces griseomycini]